MKVKVQHSSYEEEVPVVVGSPEEIKQIDEAVEKMFGVLLQIKDGQVAMSAIMHLLCKIKLCATEADIKEGKKLTLNMVLANFKDQLETFNAGTSRIFQEVSKHHFEFEE